VPNSGTLQRTNAFEILDSHIVEPATRSEGLLAETSGAVQAFPRIWAGRCSCFPTLCAVGSPRRGPGFRYRRSRCSPDVVERHWSPAGLRRAVHAGARAVRVGLGTALAGLRCLYARRAFPPGPLVDAAGVRPPWLWLGSPWGIPRGFSLSACARRKLV